MNDQPVIVIGAGIVGTATARALQREGHAVTLIDSGEPGRATSYGNAGFIAIDHVLPLARPSTLKRVPQMLMDRNGPLTVHPPSIPALLPWMARFALAAYSQEEVQKGVDSFGPLMAEANIAWKAEIQASGLGELFRTQGALYVYESEAGLRVGRRGTRAAKRQGHGVRDRRRQPRARAGAGPERAHRARRPLLARHAHHQSLQGGDDAGRALHRRRRHPPARPRARLRPRRQPRDLGRDHRPEPARQGRGDRGRPRLGRADAAAGLQRAAGRRARLSRHAGARQCALRTAGEPGRARLLHHAHGGRPARWPAPSSSPPRTSRRRGIAPTCWCDISRTSSPASAAPSRAAGSASGRPCPTSGRRSAARRGWPMSIAATATSMSG